MRLPELMVIGAQKCGTTTLHLTLSGHPGIRAAVDPRSGEVVKELDFFTTHWERGADWYRAHFQSPIGIAMESTPNYLSDLVAQRRMADLVPQAKLVVTLRDPVRRAISQFNHYSQAIDRSRDWDWRRPGDSFAINIAAELAEPMPCWHGLINRGKYCEQLTSLFALFPRRQIHVLIMERWIADPQSAMDELMDFAELDRYPLRFRPGHIRDYTSVAVDPQDAERLREHFRVHNERLFELLGQPIPEWDLSQ